MNNKIDKPFAGMNDWDILQASFEYQQEPIAAYKKFDHEIMSSFSLASFRDEKRAEAEANIRSCLADMLETNKKTPRTILKKAVEKLTRYPGRTPRWIWDSIRTSEYPTFSYDLWIYISKKFIKGEPIIELPQIELCSSEPTAHS